MNGIAKAVVGAIAAGATMLGVALSDSMLTGAEVAAVIGEIGAAGGLVWALRSRVVSTLKAWIGAGVTLTGPVLQALEDGQIAGDEWGLIAGGVAVAWGAIYGTYNEPSPTVALGRP